MERVGIRSYLHCRYRGVQCVFTHSTFTDKDEVISIPLLLLFISFIPVIIVTFMNTVRIDLILKHTDCLLWHVYSIITSPSRDYFILWIRHRCTLFGDSTGEYVLYDKEEEGQITTQCAKIQLASLLVKRNGTRYRDIYTKNEVIKLLKQLTDIHDAKRTTLLKESIMRIHETKLYIQLLDDCFQYGIDLSNTYSTLLSICSNQIKNETPDSKSEENEVILRQLNYYSTVVTWFYRLLHLYQERQKKSFFVSEGVIDGECCEILQIQKLYEDQFQIPSSLSSSSFSFRDLPFFIQCIQSVCRCGNLLSIVLSLQTTTCSYSFTIILIAIECFIVWLFLWWLFCDYRVFQCIWRSVEFSSFWVLVSMDWKITFNMLDNCFWIRFSDSWFLLHFIPITCSITF